MYCMRMLRHYELGIIIPSIEIHFGVQISILLNRP
jgi:hypothetical protein